MWCKAKVTDGQNGLRVEPCILPLVSKPQRPHLCQAAPTAAPSLEAQPRPSPHYLPYLTPLLLPFCHPHSPQQPEGKGMFYHVTALLTALQGSPGTFKIRSRSLIPALKAQHDPTPVEPLTTDQHPVCALHPVCSPAKWPFGLTHAAPAPTRGALPLLVPRPGTPPSDLCCLPRSSPQRPCSNPRASDRPS